MCIFTNMFGFESIVSFFFIWLCLKAVTEPNSAKPTTIAKWVCTESTENGVIKAGTNAWYQNLLASKCYLTCKHEVNNGSLANYRS